VGLFLSAGVDSNVLLAIASQLSPRPLKTVTLAFEEFSGGAWDEAPQAAASAKHYGAEHHSVVISAQTIKDQIGSFLSAMDQPSLDGLNSYLVSQAVRTTGLKAALSGLGGDELFGGYPSFERFPLMRRLAPLGKIAMVPQLFASLASKFLPPRQQTKVRALPAALQQPESSYHLLRGLFVEEELEKIFSFPPGRATALTRELLPPNWRGLEGRAWTQNALAEQTMYMRNQLLRDSDWASMAHGLELRVPLVDRKLSMALASGVAQRKGANRKSLLASSVQPSLPSSILNRPKTGFALPLQAWVGEDCRKGWRPKLPSWMLGPRGREGIETLAQGVGANRVHWSRIWSLRILEHQLESGLS